MGIALLTELPISTGAPSILELSAFEMLPEISGHVLLPGVRRATAAKQAGRPADDLELVSITTSSGRISGWSYGSAYGDREAYRRPDDFTMAWILVCAASSFVLAMPPKTMCL